MFKVEELNCESLKNIECNLFDRYVKLVDCNDAKNFCILPENMKNVITKMKSMEIYEDDVWIVTRPKCGTTWTQEMVWLINNNLDFETAQNVETDDRVPYIEMEGLWGPGSLSSFQEVVNLKRPRIIKTHLPTFLLPDEVIKGKAKIIYVTRNPKDAFVSYYNHGVHFEGWKNASVDIAIDLFVNERMIYAPFNDHVLKFWELSKSNEKILFLHFEDMKRDLKSVVREVAKFLGKNYSSNEFDELCTHLSFDQMKNNKMANKSKSIEMVRKLQGRENDEPWNFMRKGKVGSYKEELTPEQNELLNAYARQMEGTDFKYKFE